MAAINYDFPLEPNGHSESELITALYLYGDKVEVQNGNVIIPKEEALLDSSLIREELVVPAGTTNPNNINIDIIEVQVDEVDYMTNGPGRFANGYQFDLVKAFFGETAAAMKSKNGRENYKYTPALLKTFGSANYDSQGNLISRTYKRKDIDQIYFQNRLEGYSANHELRDYDDGTDNFNQRIYTGNSQQFSLPDSVDFVVYFDLADPKPTSSTPMTFPMSSMLKHYEISPTCKHLGLMTENNGIQAPSFLLNSLNGAAIASMGRQFL